MVSAQNVWSFIFQEKYAGYQELLYQMNVYVFRFDPELFICFNFSSALNLCLSCFSFVRLECDIAYKWLTCICRSVSRIVLRNAYTKMFWSINFGSAENEISFTVALNIPCVCLRSTNGGAVSTMQIGARQQNCRFAILFIWFRLVITKQWLFAFQLKFLMRLEHWHVHRIVIISPTKVSVHTLNIFHWLLQ